MIRIIFCLLFFSIKCFSQNSEPKIVYIIDSIPVVNDPEEGNEISNTDISDINVIKNRDSLKLLGYEKADGAIYIFTKEYRNRSAELKRIPSTLQMEKKDGSWYFNGNIYNGKFVDYYYSGRKQGEGMLQKGKLEGARKMYFQNGKLSMERNYSNGIENGLEKQFYEDGSLQQKGEFVNGNEEGLWEMYFPNGQVKQKSVFRNGIIEGETTVFYSTGRILSAEMNKNGKTIPDKRLEKITQLMTKSRESYKIDDHKAAIKYCSKAIEIDSTYAEAYFTRGTIKLNDMQFDEAISDFDKALLYEPYYAFALANRAFARIRKFQFKGSRTISSNKDVTVLASKDKPDDIPADELNNICSDLNRATLLGDKAKMVMQAVTDFCKTSGQIINHN